MCARVNQDRQAGGRGGEGGGEAGKMEAKGREVSHSNNEDRSVVVGFARLDHFILVNGRT